MELVPPLPVRRPDGGLTWEPAIDRDTAERFHEAARAAVDPESTRRLRQLERRAGVLRALVGTVRTLIRDGLR